MREKVEIATMDNKDENPREKARVRDRPALHEGILWKLEIRQDKSKVLHVRKHLSVPFMKRELQSGE